MVEVLLSVVGSASAPVGGEGPPPIAGERDRMRLHRGETESRCRSIQQINDEPEIKKQLWIFFLLN